MFDMNIECACPMCGEIKWIAVRSDDYEAWLEGKHAQDAFPYLSADEREMLISGICPKCWDSMCDEEEDE